MSEQCPHGENCACAISTRHEWFIAFCDERDKPPSLTPADLIALRDDFVDLSKRVDALGGRHEAGAYRYCAMKLDALITRLSSETEKT